MQVSRALASVRGLVHRTSHLSTIYYVICCIGALYAISALYLHQLICIGYKGIPLQLQALRRRPARDATMRSHTRIKRTRARTARHGRRCGLHSNTQHQTGTTNANSGTTSC
jgi:hypothetical protein